MSDQVVMSKANGNLAIAIPLYRYHHEEQLGNLKGFSIALTNGKPLAYVIVVEDQAQVMNAEVVERNLEFLGDL